MNIVNLRKIRPFCPPAMGVAGRGVPQIFRCAVARVAGMYGKWIWACIALLSALCSLPCQAKGDDLADEPPKVRAMLNEAVELELAGRDYGEKRAASLYCKASRLGSLDAQYRLGMLYLSGRGVPKNPDFASVLFSQAAQQGYSKAADMLEVVRLHTLKLPSCIVSPPASPGQPEISDKLGRSE